MPPLEALAIDLYRKPGRVGPLRLFALLFGRQETRRAITLIRFSQHCHGRKRPRLQRWAERRLRREFGCFVQGSVVIGPGLKLPHPNGIVLGSGVRIGADCVLYHQVTLGGARRGDWQAGNYPQVGSGVTIFAGAKILGAINVGDDSVIGANAVVVADVPRWHTAKGIPARSSPRRDASHLRNMA